MAVPIVQPFDTALGLTQDDAFFKSDFPSSTPGSHIEGRRARFKTFSDSFGFKCVNGLTRSA
jgi:hypothetical protein